MFPTHNKHTDQLLAHFGEYLYAESKKFDQEDQAKAGTFASRCYNLTYKNVVDLPATTRRRWAWFYLAFYDHGHKLQVLTEAHINKIPLSLQKRFLKRALTLYTRQYGRHNQGSLAVKYCQTPLWETIVNHSSLRQCQDIIVYHLLAEKDLEKWKIVGPHLNLKRNKSSILVRALTSPKNDAAIHEELFEWLLPQTNPKGNHYQVVRLICEKMKTHPDQPIWGRLLGKVLPYVSVADVLLSKPEKEDYAVLIPYAGKKCWEKLKKDPKTIYQHTPEFQKRLLTDVANPNQQTPSLKRKM